MILTGKGRCLFMAGKSSNGAYRALGQLFMMGFDGTTVTPHIKELIEKHHLGSILLTAKY